MSKEKLVAERDSDVAAAGHICLDIIPKFPGSGGKRIEELFKPGKLVNVEEAAISTGGPVSNTGLALHRLGARVEFMGKVGDDDFGRIVLEKLSDHAAAEGMRIARGENTSYTIVVAPPGIDRVFLHNPGANNTFGYEDINFDIVGKAKIFHLGYPPLMRRLYENDGDQLARIYKKARELGVVTSLDVSLPDPDSPSGKVDWRTVLEKVLPYVDIFFPSAEEMLYMLEKEEFLRKLKSAEGKDLLSRFEGEDLTRLSGKMLGLGARIAGIKCGYRGFYVRTAVREELSLICSGGFPDLDNWAGRELWEPSYHVSEIASATGSGDSAIAGFLAAYLKGKTIEMSLKYACTVGAQNVRVLDAVSGICSWEETTRQVEENRGKNELSVRTPGWRFDEEGKVWIGPHDRS
ncbi:MAG: carbohydrate kinase family protein [Candidatus Omnitrophota bacterium]